jgi:hypothetical protein
MLGLFAIPLLAAIDGRVVNQTTGQPLGGITVSLVNLTQGMQPAGTTEAGADGTFRFSQELAGPVLVQVTHQGVNYSKLLPPGQPRTGVELDVFDATPDRRQAGVTQHMVLLEPVGDRLRISETLLVENRGKTTIVDPVSGAVRMFLPGAAQGEAKVNVTSPGSTMPLSRSLEKAGNAYRIDAALKPGETKIDLEYSIPFADGSSYKAEVLHGGGPVRLVAPRGVQLSGEGITFVDREPTTQAGIWDVSGSRYAVKIEGQGALRREQAEEESSTPEVEVVPAPIHEKRFWVMGLMAGILVLAGLRYLGMESRAA